MTTVRSASHRGGVTLLEIVVVLSIVALLAALILPAVQSSRESARRLACQTKLRDLTLAWQQATDPREERTGPRSSIFLRLAPYLESGDGRAARPEELPHEADRQALRAMLTPRLLCASDGRGDVGHGTISYVFNRGIDHAYGTGVMNFRGLVAVNGFPDGASQTMFASERVIPYGSGVGDPVSRPTNVLTDADPLLHLWYLPRDYELFVDDTDSSAGGMSGWRAAVDAAVGERVTVRPILTRVSQRAVVVGQRCGFGTLSPPNTPSCFPLRSRNGIGLADRAVDNEAILDPPTSRHHGGVNVATADGAARFLSETIDLSAWIRLGTRSGEESRLSGFE